MKRLLAVALVLALLGLTEPARATIGTIDQAPAATLLVPYFEVDLDNPNGVNTLLSINNASATAVLVHVTLWSDLSVPTFSFDVYLTGFDVQTISLRDIFVNGVVPNTASVGQDPKDTISNQGPVSQDINFASCSGFLPYPTFAQLLAQHNNDPFFDYKTHVQNAHTGQPVLIYDNKCTGTNQFDRIARGYVTMDTVTQCSVGFPSDTGYFTGVASYQNVLYGDYFYVNSAQNFAQGETMVHVEACQPGDGFIGYVGTSADSGCPFSPGDYTFYSRYVAAAATDQREPLATSFASRFILGGGFDGGTDLIVWRDSKIKQDAFTCPAGLGNPAWVPLGQEKIVIFDEQENGIVANFSPFPIEAQRRTVGSVHFPVPVSFGWLYMNLNTFVPGGVAINDQLAAQAWVTTLHSASGRFSVGYHATQLDNATEALHFAPGP